jgi:pyruvate dehydrogenase E2 component (dihydrolipoamide acetyltransferase)
MDFKLPALGEGIDSATVVGVLVNPGDRVTAGTNVLAVETDKASVEVPIDVEGTIGEIKVKPGDKVPVGGVLLSLANGATASGGRQSPVSETPKSTPPKAESAPKTESGDSRPPLAASEFTLPPLGEGIEAATVVGVLVKEGEEVTAGQNVLAVETDKASVEVPVSAAGTVTAIHVKPGDKVPVGAKLLSLKGAGAAAPAEVTTTPKAIVPPAKKVPDAPKPAASTNAEPAAKDLTPAGPATRRLARELGIAVHEVKGSGRGGRVTLEDLKAFVREERKSAKGGAVVGGKTVADSFTTPALPDFSKFGEVEKKAVSGLRKKIAENLTVAWRTMPMVTQNDVADITDLEAGRKRIVESLPKGAAKITWTVLAVKAVVAALKEFPNFNSSFDMNAGELILKKYYHIGIAVDTERGLVVPVIKDADKKSIRDIAVEVASLADKARSGKLAIDDMRGGTFTITNLGGIGGTSFTPIVNYPEVAILGMSKSALQAVVKDGKVEPRLMLPLSLSYDHRVIDGADGARFTTRLAQLFSDPMRLLMES